MFLVQAGCLIMALILHISGMNDCFSSFYYWKYGNVIFVECRSEGVKVNIVKAADTLML